MILKCKNRCDGWFELKTYVVVDEEAILLDDYAMAIYDSIRAGNEEVFCSECGEKARIIAS